MDNLGADLLQETEDWHLFMLEARLDGKKRREQIKRQPTKAENEEQVSEADRKKHDQIAAAVEQRLRVINPEGENPSFEEFYAALKAEAKILVKTYQPQLRKGIKITIDLINAVEKDKKDGDVDIEIKIAPNTSFKVVAINFVDTTEEEELAKITDDDRAFLEDVREVIDRVLENNGEILDDEGKEVHGKNNASKAIFGKIERKVQDLVNEYKSQLEYGDISMKQLGGGDDRALKFTRTYTKDGNTISVNLGSIKVTLEKDAGTNGEKEKQGKLIPKMQPYRDDVWTKGPHLDIVRADNNALKITEALLDVVSGRLVWNRFGDMGGATSNDLKEADRIISGLLKNSSIMAQAKSQAAQALSEMEATINSN